MKTLLIIMAHKESQATFDRHLPLWEAHGCDLVIFCPEDSIVNTRGHFLWAYGPKGHHSASANKRFKTLIRLCNNSRFDRFFICEYDAFCLTPAIPVFYEWSDQHTPPKKDFCRPYVCGNVFRDNRPDSGFEGTTFIHPPLLFTKYGIERIDIELRHLRDDCEQGFWDRMLGLACENAGIEPMDFMAKGLGFARNTVELSDEQAALEAAANGAVFFHGIKSYSALEAITQGHAQAKANGKLREGLEIPL